MICSMKTRDAVKIFGNKRRISIALGISRAAVSAWGKVVPPLRVYQLKEIIEKMRSSGEIEAEKEK